MATRVLHLIKGLGPGGAEQLLVNQARATVAPDLDVEVAYLVPQKDQLVGPLVDAGWATTCLGATRAWDLRWLPRLRRLLKDRVVVVHGHSPLVSSMARILLRTISTPKRPRSIYTEHNDWRRHRRPTRALNHATIRLEDRVLAVSDAVRESMPARLEVEVLFHGIDARAVAAQRASRSEVRAELDIGDDETVIGLVANYRQEKGYDVAMEAAARVVAAEPLVRFVSVGQGPLEAEIRALHARLGLGDRFLLLGYRQDATRIMSGFDVFTLASRYEGLPVSLMEAMALALPVVATAVGGVPDAVADYPSVIVEPDDVDALAEAYLAAVRCPLPAPEPYLGFSAAAASERLADLYREVHFSGQ